MGLQSGVNMVSLDKVILALDGSRSEVERWLEFPFSFYKVGMELFYAEGGLVQEIKGRDKRVFLDLKLHDIPNTVYKAAYALGGLGIDMINAHAQGGLEMLKAFSEGATEGALAKGYEKPLVIGVTILTSLSETELKRLGYLDKPEDLVLRYGHLCKESLLDGVVCSPKEVKAIKEALGQDFLTVTPGIRLAGDSLDDQRRISTPKEAFKAGADYLVIGRSVTKANVPSEVIERLAGELQ